MHLDVAQLLTCDWLISNLYYQAIEQVYLIKWPVSVYVYIYNLPKTFNGNEK